MMATGTGPVRVNQDSGRHRELGWGMPIWGVLAWTLYLELIYLCRLGEGIFGNPILDVSEVLGSSGWLKMTSS